MGGAVCPAHCTGCMEERRHPPLSKYILEMKNITKEFPGVKALDNVNLQVGRGKFTP